MQKEAFYFWCNPTYLFLLLLLCFRYHIKKIFAKTNVRELFPSRSFMVCGLILINAFQSNFILLHVVFQFSQHHLLKVLFFLHWVLLTPLSNIQFSSVAQSCPTVCNPMNRSTPGLPVHHQLPEFTQTHVHWLGDAIQPSHPLSSASPPAPNPSQHQGLFQWINSSHQVAKVLEFQLQHQSFQWIFRTGFL